MYKVQYLIHGGLWQNGSGSNTEVTAIQSALRLVRTGRYLSVRVLDPTGSVVFVG